MLPLVKSFLFVEPESEGGFSQLPADHDTSQGRADNKRALVDHDSAKVKINSKA
jgi:hypothetical protein